MTTSKSTSSHSTLAIVSVFLGCAACCALPLLATVGVAGASAGFISWLAGSPLLTAVAVAIVVFFLGWLWQRTTKQRRRTAAWEKCTTSCDVDLNCCSGDAKRTSAKKGLLLFKEQPGDSKDCCSPQQDLDSTTRPA